MKDTEKYIVVRPVYMNVTRKTCPEGTIITVDRKSNRMVIWDKEFDGLTEFDVALKIKSRPIIPYEETKEVRQILERVKARLDSVPVKATLPVVESDIDLQDDIDITHTKYVEKKPEKRTDSLKVVKAEERVIELPKEEDVVEEKKREAKKMKIVNASEDGAGKTLGEVAKPVVKGRPSISMKRRKKQ